MFGWLSSDKEFWIKEGRRVCHSIDHSTLNGQCRVCSSQIEKDYTINDKGDLLLWNGSGGSSTWKSIKYGPSLSFCNMNKWTCIYWIHAKYSIVIDSMLVENEIDDGPGSSFAIIIYIWKRKKVRLMYCTHYMKVDLCNFPFTITEIDYIWEDLQHLRLDL